MCPLLVTKKAEPELPPLLLLELGLLEAFGFDATFLGALSLFPVSLTTTKPPLSPFPIYRSPRTKIRVN